MASADIVIRRGTTKPDIAWRLGSDANPFDGTGSTFVLTIRSGGNSIVLSTAEPASGLTYDNDTRLLLWRRTLADSRKISAGRVGRYEVERRIGGEQSTIVEGAVTGKDSISDD